MKIAYIGARDPLSEAFIMRMKKEGDDVYFLSKTSFHQTVSEVFRHRFFRISLSGDSFRKIITSIGPDYIVFAGGYYMDSVYQEEEEEDVTLLTRTLQILPELQRTKFIFLSSTELYGDAGETVEEDHEPAPRSERGIRFAVEERMLEVYKKQYGLHVSVIRASQLYSDVAEEEGKDFLSRAYRDVITMNTDLEQSRSGQLIQPLHVSDFVDGIRRVMDVGEPAVFHVTGSRQISQRSLYEWIGKLEGISVQGIRWEENSPSVFADNSRIKKEREWTDFRNLEDLIVTGGISFRRKKVSSRKQKKSRVPAGVRKTLENVLIFAAFFAVCYASAPHGLFSQIDWLIIYVILTSVAFGIRQSALSVLLASAAYLSMQDLSILEMTNFYSYAGSVLKIMEFVLLGLVVSYTTDMLREDLRDARRELSMRGEEYEELKKINDENVMIKNEYEERLLDSKSGFPKLYSIISRLMVLQPDRIFMEIVHIVAEMVHTDTVAVYRVRENSSYLRLINALNEASAIQGKSWDLSEWPQIREAIDAGTLYQGNIWKKEPAIVLPILYQETCVAAILIRELPYTSRTLYYVNLLQTLSLLLKEAVARAIGYEELSREERYLEGTDILKPEPFRAQILLAKEKAKKNLAQYCIAELTYTDGFEKGYEAVSARLRTTDYFGVGEDGAYYVLLNNTDAKDVEYLQERLADDGVTVAVTNAFEDSEE